MKHHAPGVDDDAGAYPVVVLIEEERQVVLVLAVEVFLVGHVAVVVAFYQHRKDGACVFILHQSSYGQFRQCGGYGGGGTAAVRVHVGCARSGVIRLIVEQLVIEQGVVVSHQAVFVRNLKAESVDIYRLAGKMLQDDAYCLGIFGEGYVDVVCARLVGQGAMGNESMENRSNFFYGSLTVFVVFPVDGAGQFFQRRYAGSKAWHVVRLP